jgi:hypothetical protein
MMEQFLFRRLPKHADDFTESLLRFPQSFLGPGADDEMDGEGGLCGYEFIRLSRLATTVNSSSVSTGLETCDWYPAERARSRSSNRA